MPKLSLTANNKVVLYVLLTYNKGYDKIVTINLWR